MWNDFISRVGTALSDIESQGDDASWEKAQIIVDADHEADTYPEMQGKKPWQVRHCVVQALRGWWQAQNRPHPRASFISDARELYDQRPELFRSGTQKLPYQHYRQMAVCSLPKEERDEFRTWAETEHRNESRCVNASGPR